MKLRNVQALRALAALLVVGDHLPRDEAKVFPHGLLAGFGAGGALGVDLFFVISGLIMIVTTRNTFGKPDAPRSFLERRALRIYPPYWVATLAFVAMSLIAPRIEHLRHFSAWDLVASLLLVPHEGGPLMFVAWSLQFEMYFYLVFTVAMFFTRERLKFIVAGWIAITLACNVAWFFGNTNIAIGFIGTPLSLEFMTGMGIGILVTGRRVFAPRSFIVAGALLLAAAVVYSARFDGFDSWSLAWYRVLVATPGIAMLVYGACTLEAEYERSVHGFFVRIGDASYTMYLWHNALLGAYTALFARLHLHGTAADLAFALAGYAVVIAGSFAIYRAVELPLLQFFHRAGAGAPRARLDAAN